MAYSIYGVTDKKGDVHPHPTDKCGVYIMTADGFKRADSKPEDTK